MEDDLPRPNDTREFIAQWNAVTADHLAHKLGGVLQQLTSSRPGLTALDAEQAAALAPVLLSAFQVAASADGGVHAAVQFLGEYAARPDE
jgi:hypothetical protein